MNASQQKMLDQVYVMWTEMRRFFFWLRWAFLVLFAAPSVIFCAALAIYSDFSFASIPQEVLQFAADTTKYPAARDGYLSVQACLDDPTPLPASGTRPLRPTPCQRFGIKQESITSMAKQASGYLWNGYVVAVSFAVFLFGFSGLFANSRRAFLASIVRAPSDSNQTVA
jgi:hypothetical protein